MSSILLDRSVQCSEETEVADGVRVGVIGTGFGATVVAPAFEATDGCEVVEVVTPRDEAAVAALCARPDVDLISVHSPPFLHLQHVRWAIEAGHAVLCDKPFGLNADESRVMTELAKEAGVVNLLNFERRFDPGREKLRELINSGAIGDPNHFQYSRFIAAPGRPYSWLCNQELGGGWLAGQGSHLIDACRWLFGEITEAAAVTRTALAERPGADGQLHPCDADDGFVATLKTATGVTAVIDCSLETPVSTPEHTAVFGSTGMLQLDDDGIVLHAASGDVETHPVDLHGKPSLILSMERWAAIVCDAARSGVVAPGSPTFADGLACAVVMDQMLPSARQPAVHQ
jgi:predicted dehydrogenase